MEASIAAAGENPLPTFSSADTALFVNREEPKRPWKDVTQGEKDDAKGLGERLKLAAEVSRGPFADHLPVTAEVSNFHLRGSAQRDLWACVYPVAAGHKSYALQIAMIISRDGAEICCCLGSGSSSVGDPAKLQKYSEAWKALGEGLGSVPPEIVSLIEEKIDSSPLSYSYFKSWREPTGAADFGNLHDWLEHASTGQRAQASVSAFIPAAELDERGGELASLMRETAEVFVPLFESAYASADQGEQPLTGSSSDHKPAVLSILQGPPGTGKTFRAKRQAVIQIDGTVSSDEAEVTRRHTELVESQRIFWVTFHPSYSYEDFVEGYRPRLVDGQVAYQVVDGPFKRACAACGQGSFESRMWSLTPGQKIGLNVQYEVREVRPDGVVLKSQVNRKDAVNPEREVFTDLWTIERFRERGVKPDELSHAGQNQAARTDVARRAEVPTTLLNSSGHYRALYEHLESLPEESAQPVVLVIDEINRADLSRVFGELMTLIESDKRRGALEESSVILPYSGKAFTVPAELSIIGTMNTVDRSLAVVDVAFRRRFEFIDIEPDPMLCPDAWGGVPIREVLTLWNERLTFLESRDGRLGHSEFMAHRLEAIRVANGWSPDDDGRRRAFAYVTRTKVIPLLLEYFHEDWRRADAVLGAMGLLQAVAPAPDLAPLIDEYLDVDEAPAFEIGSWWDPTSQLWDGERFLVNLG